ncbi:MAG: hypothetical protein GY926_20720 [bacterium]|nr:hypothetical protein [bacterium]
MYQQLAERRPWYQSRAVGAFRVIVGGMSVVVGLGMVMVVYAFGHCSAFGGTCPGAVSFDAGAFRAAAAGAALAIGVPVFVSRPSRSQLGTAVVWALLGGGLVGLVVGTAVTG